MLPETKSECNKHSERIRSRCAHKHTAASEMKKINYKLMQLRQFTYQCTANRANDCSRAEELIAEMCGSNSSLCAHCWKYERHPHVTQLSVKLPFHSQNTKARQRKACIFSLMHFPFAMRQPACYVLSSSPPSPS